MKTEFNFLFKDPVDEPETSRLDFPKPLDVSPANTLADTGESLELMKVWDRVVQLELELLNTTAQARPAQPPARPPTPA
jgi:hypothetical protein